MAISDQGAATSSGLTERTPRPPVPTGELATLSIGALLLLAATGFTAIVTETLPAGLLPQIAHSLALGALVLAVRGASLLSTAMLPLVALGLGIAVTAKRYAFTRSPRAA